MNRRTDLGFLVMAAFAISVLDGRMTLAQSASPSDTAEAVAPIAGDYNSNGLVEQGDLDLVLGNWGKDLTLSPVPNWTNDAPSGIVSQAELDRVLINWGKRASGVVPEPATLSLVLASAIAGFALWRCRKARA